MIILFFYIIHQMRGRGSDFLNNMRRREKAARFRVRTLRRIKKADASASAIRYVKDVQSLLYFSARGICVYSLGLTPVTFLKTLEK